MLKLRLMVVGDPCREFDGLYCIHTVFLWKTDDLIFLKFIIRVIKMNIDTEVNKHNHDRILHQQGCKLMAEMNVCIAEMKSSLSGVLQLMIQLPRSAGLRKRAAGDTLLKSSNLNPGHMQGTHLAGFGAEFPQPYLSRRPYRSCQLKLSPLSVTKSRNGCVSTPRAESVRAKSSKHYSSVLS